MNFDSIRKLLMMPVIEKILACPPKRQQSLIGRILPGNYLYPKNAVRKIQKDGICLELDLHDYLEHFIFYNYITSEDEALFSAAKPDMIVFDIGTNIGYVALKLAKLVGSEGKVYGFEPDSVNFRKASRNIKELNPWCKNLQIFNLGLGDQKGQFKLYSIEESNNGMHQVRKEDVPGRDFSMISIEVIDEYITKSNIPGPQLIKIDTEGYEMNVLLGSIKTIQTYRPVLFIEVDDNNLRLQNQSATVLIDFISNLNYNIINIQTGSKVSSRDNFSNCHFDVLCNPN
jgi:FkbM family methyltransferase